MKDFTYIRHINKLLNKLAFINECIQREERWRLYCTFGPGNPEDWNEHCEENVASLKAYYRKVKGEYEVALSGNMVVS